MDEPAVPPASDAPKPQFRTYASDVARLTGKPLQKNVANTPAPLPAPVAPPPSAPPKAPPVAEPIAPAPSAPLSPKPYDPPPAQIIPKAPTTDESRDAVLARLRARAVPQQPAQPAPEGVVIPNAPSTNEKREEVLARLRKNAGAPAPSARPEPPPGLPPINRLEQVPAPAPIHTYKSDFSDQAKETGASRISILAAEQNARGRAPVPQLKPKKKSRALFIAGAVLLILAGGASVYFAFSFVTGHPPVLVGPSVPSLIFADEHDELSGTGSELRQGLADLSSHSLPAGGVAVAYVTYASTTAKGSTVMLPADGGALISALGLSAPDILLRNIDPASTVGVVHAGDETRPFFIFRVASFERTFAGMLDWEGTMPSDLALFYPAYPEEAKPAATTTATTSAAVHIAFTLSFADEVVDNHDVRVFRDSSGRSIVLYGYRDKETLIIARDEAAFSELLQRLASTRAQ